MVIVTIGDHNKVYIYTLYIEVERGVKLEYPLSPGGDSSDCICMRDYDVASFPAYVI